MPFQLHIRHNIEAAEDHFAAGRVVRFDQAVVRVGSAPACECRLDEADLDPVHVTIELPDNGPARVVPVGTAYLGDSPITAPAELWSGDEIRVGHWTFRFQRLYGAATQARRTNLLAVFAKGLVVTMLLMETLVVVWLPVRLRNMSLWQQEIARQRTAMLLDNLRRRNASIKTDDLFLKGAHAAIGRDLENRVRYLRDCGPALTPEQHRRMFSDLNACADMLTGLTSGQSLNPLPEIDLDAGVRAIVGTGADAGEP